MSLGLPMDLLIVMKGRQLINILGNIIGPELLAIGVCLCDGTNVCCGLLVSLGWRDSRLRGKTDG